MRANGQEARFGSVQTVRWWRGADGLGVGIRAHGFDSSGCVTTLDRSSTPLRPSHQAVYLVLIKGWWRSAAGKVTAGPSRYRLYWSNRLRVFKDNTKMRWAARRRFNRIYYSIALLPYIIVRPNNTGLYLPQLYWPGQTLCKTIFLVRLQGYFTFISVHCNLYFISPDRAIGLSRCLFVRTIIFEQNNLCLRYLTNGSYLDASKVRFEHRGDLGQS